MTILNELKEMQKQQLIIQEAQLKMNNDLLELARKQHEDQLELAKKQHKEKLEVQSTHKQEIEVHTSNSAQMAQVYAFKHSYIMGPDANFIRERLALRCEDVLPSAEAWHPAQIGGVKPFQWKLKRLSTSSEKIATST